MTPADHAPDAFEASDAPTVPAPPAARSRSAWVSAGVVLGLLITVIGLSAYGGYRAGLTQRTRQAQEAAQKAADEQYALGLEDFDAGRYDLARTRFEYVLSSVPGYPGAAQRLGETLRFLNATATPTSTPLPTPSSTRPDELFAQAQEFYKAQNWDGVIVTLTTLHGVDPKYEAIKSDGMMYVALRTRGLERIKAGELEQGIYDMAQAERIGPLDADADAYRAWAELYLAADSYWGLNWARAANLFGQLHAAAPFFLDTQDKYYQSLRNYGDQLALAGDACAAEKQYALAQSIKPDQAVADAQATAQATCLLATPTPDPNLTPTLDPNATPTIDPNVTPTPDAATPTPGG